MWFRIEVDHTVSKIARSLSSSASSSSHFGPSQPRMAKAETSATAAKGAGAAADREWRPAYPITFAPLFDPAQWELGKFSAYFFGFPGFFAPWNILYFALTVASHHYTTPPLEACRTFAAGWLAQLFLRNMALLWIFAGGWHALLYWPFRAQGLEKKYERRFPDPAPAVGANKWILGSQTAENVFVSCSSGVLTWTAYEAIFLRLWAVGAIPGAYFDWWEQPLWSCAQLLAIPIWREFHFYFTHRAMHWKPLYKRVHYLHHKNVNPGKTAISRALLRSLARSHARARAPDDYHVLISNARGCAGG